MSYRHFYKKCVEDSANAYPNDYLKMIAIHDKLNLLPTLDYKKTRNDPHYLALLPYPFLERDILRTDYTEHIYYNLFYRLDSVYYFTIFPDKRLKRFNVKKASVTMPSRNIFAFRMNNSFYYLHSQNSYTKYNLNELPFYFENELVVNIPQNIKSIEKCTDVTNKADVIYTYTPESQSADNYRQIAGAIKIDLQNNNLSFNGKVSLSGQYSTLLRNFYQNNLIDPTINERYKKRMSDKAEKKSINYSLLSSSIDYPFKTYYSGSFTIAEPVKNSDANKSIEITNWFNYVYPDSDFVNSKTHQFDFFPDFLSSDKFKYQLNFDKAVEITKLSEFNIEIHNEYADFHAALKKMDDTNYIFDSFLEIKMEKVEAQKINLVEDITKAIDKFTNRKLLVKQL